MTPWPSGCRLFVLSMTGLSVLMTGDLLSGSTDIKMFTAGDSWFYVYTFKWTSYFVVGPWCTTSSREVVLVLRVG